MKIKSVALVFVVCTLIGCGSSSSSPTRDACTELSNDSFSCDAMLGDLVSEGVIPIIQRFNSEIEDLDDAVIEYCDDSNKLAAARDAWTAAMASLQQLQVMRFGPNADADNGLLSFYDWQTASPFNIDIAIAQRTRFPNTVSLPSSDNEKDLVAVEYVLFDVDAIQAYPDPAKENDHVKIWRESSNQIQQDRCDYAELVTGALKTKGAALNASWQQYDLSAESNVKQVAANQVAEALFYIDKVTKDAKIKDALPQKNDEEAAFDEDALESQFASQEQVQNNVAILNNLEGIKRILTLNDIDNSKTGLDDYLKAAGQQEIADDMKAALETAIANVSAIDADAYAAVSSATDIETCLRFSDKEQCNSYSDGCQDYLSASSDIEKFCALQLNVKTFTDILKGDFTLSTSFTIPASASGDND